MEKLLVVDDKYNLKGLITVKDIQKKLKYPNAAKDSHGRLRVGAAIGATSGAGAGGAVQVLTKGQRVKIPPETRLSFTLQNSVSI